MSKKPAGPEPVALPTFGRWTIYNDEETQAYDYNAARTLVKRTSVLESSMHLVKGALGLGILGIAHAFMMTGKISFILTIVFGIYVVYCIYLLISACQTLYYRLHVPNMSYSDLAEASFATSYFKCLRKFDKCFRYSVDGTIALDLFGSCCCYQIFIAKTIKQLYEGVQDSPDYGVNGGPHLRVYIALVCPIIILICLIRNLKYLAPFALAGNLLVLIVVIATVYYGLRFRRDLSTYPLFKDFAGFFEYTGVTVFSMENVGVAIAVENSMKKPKNFKFALLISSSIIILCVWLSGFFGYLGYGDDCQSLIPLNFPIHEGVPLAIKGMMIPMVIATYAVNFWVPFNLCWVYIGRKFNPDKHWLWERVFRTIFVIFLCLVAIAFPNVGNFMGFLGSLCLSLMGFIFPALISGVVWVEKPGYGKMKWRLIRSIVIFLCGLVFLINGSYINAREMILSSIAD